MQKTFIALFTVSLCFAFQSAQAQTSAEINSSGHQGNLYWTEEDSYSSQELAYDVCSKKWNQLNWSKKNNPKAMISGIKENSDRTYTSTCFARWTKEDVPYDVFEWDKLRDRLTDECLSSYSRCYMFATFNNLEKWAERQQNRIRTKSRFSDNRDNSSSAEFVASVLQGIASGLNKNSGSSPSSGSSGTGCSINLAPGESRTNSFGATKGCR